MLCRTLRCCILCSGGCSAVQRGTQHAFHSTAEMKGRRQCGTRRFVRLHPQWGYLIFSPAWRSLSQLPSQVNKACRGGREMSVEKPAPVDSYRFHYCSSVSNESSIVPKHKREGTEIPHGRSSSSNWRGGFKNVLRVLCPLSVHLCSNS